MFWCFQIIRTVALIVLLGLVGFREVKCSRTGKVLESVSSFSYEAINCRKHSASLTDFGGVGDGKTSNTIAFRKAIEYLKQFESDGGSQLIVPPGKWLSGSFNLTSSNFTLFLHKDAIILASQDEGDYPVIPQLPSYGGGRNLSDSRYAPFIFGTNLTDVVITGNNGTIDGQGAPWWDKFSKKELNYGRPFLIEIMYSDQVQISNLTLLNSPNWFVHPVYSSNVLVLSLTILAPVTVSNTDGIDPDSCTNVRIEDCYVVSGDDCIAVKSGWDEYGINFRMPTRHLIIRRMTCISPKSAVIALGSEMSGGIEDVRAEDIVAINSESAVSIKTAPGRGGYVKDIFARRFEMNTMKYVFRMTGAYRSHPDQGFDPKALPVVTRISNSDMVAKNVTMTADLAGIDGDSFTDICFSNVTIELSPKPKEVQWNCTDVVGLTSVVSPPACSLLPDEGKNPCPFPSDKLPIDDIQFQTCSY
ncbi:hypothetical protein NE237_012102 [Protea cynaroides]|uniref:Polygalacturonase n=1 Tax=Protea cynaroides TaxID=273540 RepID=A0A9Q0GXB9_9MAGN|nr:hypothetical protein NE237_012102 [Protea cynaroides]